MQDVLRLDDKFRNEERQIAAQSDGRSDDSRATRQFGQSQLYPPPRSWLLFYHCGAGAPATLWAKCAPIQHFALWVGYRDAYTGVSAQRLNSPPSEGPESADEILGVRCSCPHLYEYFPVIVDLRRPVIQFLAEISIPREAFHLDFRQGPWH